MCNACSLLMIRSNVYFILLCVPGVMAAHYSIEYRTHFTKFHATVVGFIGATEQLIIQMFFTLGCAYLSSQGLTCDQIEFTLPIVNYTTNIKEIMLFGIMASGFHWTTENYVRGYWAAKDKVYALACLIPYI